MRNSLVAAGAAVALAWSATGHVEGMAIGAIPPEPHNIVTVVGSGTDTDDGGLAMAARLDIPSAVAFDSLGNLYIAESGRHRVRKVNKATGIITTVAGTGQPAFPGYIGENIPATSALITQPVRVVFDRADNLYINGGTGSNRIHKVDAVSGLITTVVGHPNGEACPAPPTPCGDGLRATAAWLIGSPRGSLFDAEGNFYLSDTNSNRIRKVTAGTETIDAFAGTGTGGYNDDDIPATSAHLNSPRGLAFDTSGENLYIADSGNHRVRKVNLATRFITTPVGIGCMPHLYRPLRRRLPGSVRGAGESNECRLRL